KASRPRVRAPADRLRRARPGDRRDGPRSRERIPAGKRFPRMTAFLTTIMWRDTPAQVVAKDGRRAHKIVLHPRFQVAIDKAAVKADKKAFNDYVEEWRKVMRECGDDLLAEA